ncbi:hypothetical protein FGW84_00075, partial [Xylella fastidiosa subsp. multiplex]|nr:hypothetical protein [Xylella fastidiosa subsp. multiplex]
GCAVTALWPTANHTFAKRVQIYIRITRSFPYISAQPCSSKPFFISPETYMQTIGNPWLWSGFAIVVIAALLVDLIL